MEEEHNVHFSKHVFIERYLKGWCPKSGYINMSFYRISMRWAFQKSIQFKRKSNTLCGIENTFNLNKICCKK